LLWLDGLADANDIALTTDKPPRDFELTPESWTSTFGGLSLAVFGGVTPLARCAASRCALPNDTPKTNKMGYIKGNVL
jgi:hypothetical protein